MTSADRRLRISIVVRSAIAPAWIGALVERLTASPRFEVAPFLEAPAPRHAWPRAYRAYERADARMFRRRRDALAPVPLPGPPPRELAALDECDVLLHLGYGDPQAVVGATRYGVWILSHADEQERRRVPPLFWEMYRGDLYRTTLEAHLSAGERRVLYSSHGRPNRTSLHRSRNEAYWKSAGAIARALDALSERGPSYLESRPRPEGPGEHEGGGPPPTAVVVQHVAAVGIGVVARRLRKLAFKEEWFVAARLVRGGSLVDESSIELDGFRPFPAAPGEHFADPFVFEDRGEAYVFFERYDEATRKGGIAYARLDSKAEPLGAAASALNRDYHVSYPFVFRHRGEIFMIPESLENQTVDLYRAVDFPSRWVLEQRLLSGVCAVDPTLLEESSRLWLFLNIAEPGASVNDELHVYSSTSLAGPWMPHPENPVVSDVRRARPAGRIFRHGGRVIRPSQDCSRGYGTAVVFNRIDLLTTEEYLETPIARVEPRWARGLVGTHTYNSIGRLEVLDGRRFALRLPLERLATRARRRG
jgi:hypothetical protein